MTVPDIEERRDILRIAHDWRRRMAEPGAGARERADFEAWLAADAAHEEFYDRAVTFYEAMGRLEEDDLGSKVLQKTSGERWYLFRQWATDQLRAPKSQLVTAASALACMAMVALFVPTLLKERQDTVVSELVASVTYDTGIGEMEDFTLADGTAITLGAASQVEIAFSGTSRKVNLKSGAAFFDVTSDPERPFIVEAGDMKARVLGTQFDVSRSGNLIKVGVAEGSVKVSYPLVVDKTPMSILSEREVTAGEQVAARLSEGLSSVRQVNIETVGAWRTNTLYYRGERLADLVADANRYSEDQVIIEGDAERISDFRVQGSFNAKDIDGMLSDLAEVYPVVIDRSGDGLIAIRSE